MGWDGMAQNHKELFTGREVAQLQAGWRIQSGSA